MPENVTVDTNEYRNVWVFIEQEYGRINPVAYELLAKGKELANDLGQGLTAVLPGDGVAHLADDLFARGADEAVLIDDPVLKDYRTYTYCSTLAGLIDKYRPEILLVGATTLGRDLAGAVAARVGTGLTADCTRLEIDPETKLLAQTRPAFGGNVMATILCRGARPQMATVRPRVFKPPAFDPDRRGKLVREAIDIKEEEVPTKVIDFIPHEEHDDVEIDTVDLLFAGGRGLGGKENFGLLKELADLLGGEVAASRPPIEMGWVPASRQVGQTGKTVRPKLYFAAGISGAIQHAVGMQGAEIIVAVNNDPEAPIFNLATYGIVGNLFEVIPALVEEIKKIAPRERPADIREVGADV